MAYRFTLADATPQAAVRRIAREQIGRALRALEEMEHPAAIHDVRKRCKKLRALVRLVRPAFSGYREENADFRAIAGHVSGARDAQVMLDTCDRLLAAHGDELDRSALAAIRARFAEDHARREAQDGAAEFAALAGSLRAALDRVDDWRIAGHGWDAFAPGLAKCRRQARKCAARARAETVPDAIHDLRKHMKYHWYHLRLLAELWPEMMAVREAEAMEASEQLGLHHDLWVFECRLARSPTGFGTAASLAPFRALAARERARIEAEAWPRVEHLLAEPPEALAAHWGALWSGWQRAGSAG